MSPKVEDLCFEYELLTFLSIFTKLCTYNCALTAVSAIIGFNTILTSDKTTKRQILFSKRRLVRLHLKFGVVGSDVQKQKYIW